jgi:hypothetical protein
MLTGGHIMARGLDRARLALGLFILVILGSITATPAAAAPVTWEFTGSITSVASFATGYFSVGEVCTYKLTMDSDLVETEGDVDLPNSGYYLLSRPPREMFDFVATIGSYEYRYSGSFVAMRLDRLTPSLVVDTSLTGVAVDGPALPFNPAPGSFPSPAPLWNANVLDFWVRFPGATPWATDALAPPLPNSPFVAGLNLAFCPYCDDVGPGVNTVGATFTSVRQVPEPTSAMIFLLAAAGAIAFRRTGRRPLD